jgi:hypothetical protein
MPGTATKRRRFGCALLGLEGLLEVLRDLEMLSVGICGRWETCLIDFAVSQSFVSHDSC